MAFEAVSRIAKAEAAAKAAVNEAEARARRLVDDAHIAGRLGVDAAENKAEDELKLLDRRLRSRARQNAVELSQRVEKQKAALRAVADVRMEHAAELIVERILKG